jgi:hypothetical protein
VRFAAFAAAARPRSLCALTNPHSPHSPTPTSQEREFLQGRYVESEILNHSILRHPHVVQFREVFLSPRHINMCVRYARALLRRPNALFVYGVFVFMTRLLRRANVLKSVERKQQE